MVRKKSRPKPSAKIGGSTLRTSASKAGKATSITPVEAKLATEHRKPSDTREALLEAARRVFAEKGYAGATVKDLAESAGVNISLVSYHFGGKEGLYQTCLESFGADRAEASERILKAPVSREDFTLRLQLFAEDFIEFHVKNADGCKVVHRAMESIDEITCSVFKKFFFRVFEALNSFIEAAKIKRLVRDEMDSEICAILMFGSLVHLLRSQEMARLMDMPTVQDADFRERVIEQWVRSSTIGIFAPLAGENRSERP